MTSREEKRRRRGIVRDIAEKERSEQLERLPIMRGELLELFEFLEGTLFERRDDGRIWCNCEHDLKQTRMFLTDRGLPEDETVDWLGEFGGYCDCEVSANAGGHWDDYVRRLQGEPGAQN